MKAAVFAFAYLTCTALALPLRKREVPQEHSHEPILTSVRASLNLNNVDQIQDPVFGLLGNAAASAGQGKITDTDCLQQATADQAFTNAKAANDVDGMVNALIYRALERNTGKVGLASVACTAIKATNPEIAAIAQHQDAASPGAAATNKAIVLALAQQIAAVGGDPQLALQSGTFAPGDVNDPTAKGNSCDDANDPKGCIFTQNLLVEDATADEISAAVSGGAVAAATTATADAAATATATATATSSAADSTDTCPPAATVTVTVSSDGAAATATAVAAATTDTAAAATTTATSAAATTTATAAAAAGANLQTFTGALAGVSAPAVMTGGRGFQVSGSDDFLNLAAALGRSCDIQHNQCANKVNSQQASGVTVSDCDNQDTQCRAAGSA